jgi:hypothetical protein
VPGLVGGASGPAGAALKPQRMFSHSWRLHGCPNGSRAARLRWPVAERRAPGGRGLLRLSAVSGMVRSMESGQGSLGSLRACLRTVNSQVYLRAAVETGRQAVRYVDAIVGPPSVPDGWQQMAWEYEPITFIAGSTSSRALAAALDPGDAQVLPLGPFGLTLPVLSEQLSWQRKPGRARFESVILPWPTRISQLHTRDRTQQQTAQGYLIGDDCPSFPRYEDAFRAFFYGDFARSLRGQVPSEFATVRVVDGRAWLEGVRITPTSLEVSIGGNDITGIRAELNGATRQVDARVTGPGRVRLPLQQGAPRKCVAVPLARLAVARLPRDRGVCASRT